MDLSMEWLNQNSDGIQAIASIVIAAFTVALVITTIVYAKASREMTQLMVQRQAAHFGGMDALAGHFWTRLAILEVKPEYKEELLETTDFSENDVQRLQDLAARAGPTYAEPALDFAEHVRAIQALR